MSEMSEYESDYDETDELVVDVNGNLVSGTPVPEYVRMRLEHEELAARAATLAQELSDSRLAAMKELVESIVGWIDNYGLGRVEVMAELRKIIVEPKPKAKAKGKGKGTPAPMKVTTYTDAACPGQVYKRGPVPAWMKARMVSLGLDPTNPEHRKTYKADHLKAAS